MRQLLGGFLLLPTLLTAQIRSDSAAILQRAPISLPWRRFDVTLSADEALAQAEALRLATRVESTSARR